MSPANDPGPRIPPRIITPPGSIPAIGQPRNPLAPAGITPTSYSPQQLASSNLANNGLLTQGDPGRGPGFALADHVHPAAPSAGSAARFLINRVQVGLVIGDQGGYEKIEPPSSPQIDSSGGWDPSSFSWNPKMAGDFLVDIETSWEVSTSQISDPPRGGNFFNVVLSVNAGGDFWRAGWNFYYPQDVTTVNAGMSVQGTALILGLPSGALLQFATGYTAEFPSEAFNATCLKASISARSL